MPVRAEVSARDRKLYWYGYSRGCRFGRTHGLLPPVCAVRAGWKINDADTAEEDLGYDTMSSVNQKVTMDSLQ